MSIYGRTTKVAAKNNYHFWVSCVQFLIPVGVPPSTAGWTLQKPHASLCSSCNVYCTKNCKFSQCSISYWCLQVTIKSLCSIFTNYKHTKSEKWRQNLQFSVWKCENTVESLTRVTDPCVYFYQLNLLSCIKENKNFSCCPNNMQCQTENK